MESRAVTSLGLVPKHVSQPAPTSAVMNPNPAPVIPPHKIGGNSTMI